MNEIVILLTFKGKSAITVQLVSGHFVDVYDPTIEDTYRTTLSIDGNCYQIEIVDTGLLSITLILTNSQYSWSV